MKIIKFIKKNIIYLILLIILIFIFGIKYPYYIEAPGGLINLKDRVEISSYKSNGNINMAYVSEVKATAFNLLIAYLDKDWDIIKQEEVLSTNETDEENNFVNNLLLKVANNTAIEVAYKKANKEVKINKTSLYVTYIDSKANTDLKITDKIISINNNQVNTYLEASSILTNINIDEKIEIKVINNNKEYTRYAYLTKFDNLYLIGLILTEDKEITTNPTIKLSFKNNESGPSGGLMMTLAIYNNLMEKDLTKGLKISGTGTIDELGNAGTIGGVKYKLKGAVNENADIFFVPNGDNYKEAIKEQNKNNYKIKIVGVSTIDEVIEYLKNSK